MAEGTDSWAKEVGQIVPEHGVAGDRAGRGALNGSSEDATSGGGGSISKTGRGGERVGGNAPCERVGGEVGEGGEAAGTTAGRFGPVCARPPLGLAIGLLATAS